MSILGPSKNEVWSAFADEMGAQFIDDGTFKGGPKVMLKYKSWQIFLDTFTVSTGKSSTTFTRIRAVFVEDMPLAFKITKRNIFTRIAMLFGKTYALTGDNDFDNEFAIICDDGQKVKKIFDNKQLKELFYNIRHVFFTIKKAKGKKETKYVTDEKVLYYHVTGVIKDEQRLTKLFGVFIYLLDAFEKQGNAKTDVPQIVLSK